MSKPVMDPKALRAAVLVGIPTLIALLELLQAYRGKVDLLDPSFWIKVIQVVAGGLFGKEVLTGSTHIPLSELPADWVERRSNEP